MTRKRSNRKKKESVSDNFFEGEDLARLCNVIQRGTESARQSDGDTLPEKIWFKQQFAIGVNEVTRVLERMKSDNDGGNSENPNVAHANPKAPLVPLQVILYAADVEPRILTKHMTEMALSRKVPMIKVRDSQKGSARLGELVKLRVAMAIGVKARGNAINKLVKEFLQGDGENLETKLSKSFEGGPALTWSKKL